MRQSPTFRTSLLPLAAVALVLCTGTSLGENWPHWRGPHRDGISRETTWSNTSRPEIVWTKSVGLGYSCVAVSDGKLITAGWDEAREADIIWCLDALTGKELWTQSYPAQKWDKYHGGGTNCSPSIEGSRVYISNREGRVTCLGLADGAVIWARHMKDELDAKLPEWGFAGSPLVLDEMVVVNAGSAVALDKASGRDLWRSKDYGDAYATPVPFTLEGRNRLALFAGAGLAIIDPAGGSEIAVAPWKTKYDVNAATPIIIGDRAFISSGYNHGCAMLKLGANPPEVVWESKVMRNHMSTCVLIDGHLYGFDEDKALKCIDLAGTEKWAERGLGKGSLTAAGDRLIVMSGKGELLIVRADPTSFTELSRRNVLDGGQCWTDPVLANGRIYCRSSRGQLVCVDHRPEPAGNAP